VTTETAVTTTIYGIKACDTMKKARTWLDQKGVAYEFHDWKTDPPTQALLDAWVGRLGWEVLLNRAGTTFRKLPEADRTGIDAGKAVRLMLANPSAIKRPVVVAGDALQVGFSPDAFSRLFP